MEKGAGIAIVLAVITTTPSFCVVQYTGYREGIWYNARLKVPCYEQFQISLNMFFIHFIV